MISIIIPTCNRLEKLSTCLDLLSLKSQDDSDCISYEVIVTDDSSNDLTKKVIGLDYKWVLWVRGPRKGPAANRNNGARHSSGDWLLFIDDDCLPDQEILKNYHLAFARYRDKEVFEGAIIPDNWDLLKKDLAECPVNINGHCFWSANICIKKSLFDKLNGFDESYLIAAQEDQQLKLDIEAYTQQEITFLNECVVTHPVRFSTVLREIQRIPSTSKNFAIYARKNREKLNYCSLTYFTFEQYSFHTKRLMQSLKSGKLKSVLVSFAWLLYGVPLNIINVVWFKSVI